jgi:SAM-dependent methyltransferase
VSAGELHVPARFRRNYSVDDEEAIIDEAVWLIDHMCKHLGIPDLAESEVLDFGCGVRFTQAFLNRNLPIKRYVGVDAYGDMIEFLRVNVSDPRFEHVHVNAHNARYNPTGEVMTKNTSTPIDGQAFDVICLFSVFTHLAPHDYHTLLELLRRFVKPTGRLFFTLFIDEKTEGGHGLVDKFDAAARASGDPEVNAAIANASDGGHAPPVPFRDASPGEPLLAAMYSREHALELIEGTGWEVLSVSPPDIHLQHHIVCAPLPSW